MDRGKNKGKKILWERAAQHPSYGPSWVLVYRRPH
jgi:hypothetical protein